MNEEQTNEINKFRELDSEEQTTEINKYIDLEKQEPKRMINETRYTILKKERDLDDKRRARNRSAIGAGLCILGAAAAIQFGGQDPSIAIQHELDAIYSWQALGQYIQDLGPLVSTLSACAGGFIVQCFHRAEKFRQARNDLINYNSSIENVLGGEENAKAR